ncbi:hypothetical protein M427DRAFT_402292 [Gonapodya prolifera JEL478]|uniref:Uncharacterized protein n=1 Tax=Gonapodya prolifera (strain JEL478) TaxID=1344416 RepID=A0A139ATQ0_GONPJ|nr:hypothetical protein M427DRAFT_402292 [Gonapodya prolifera JEL478]|eukprot:KXS20102.1 hypothetical protein M427DRAFT_402292 [Gonapodya prolifera JEL478]
MCHLQNAFFRTKIHTEMDLFLADPSRYTRNFRSVPETLPAARSRNAVKALFPKEMEMQGYCPVTYVEEEEWVCWCCEVQVWGFHCNALFSDRFREGDKDCVAEFAGKLYAMENSEKLVKFLRKPWLYTNFRAPSSLPLRKIVVPLSQLPMVSYLEKTVASAVMSAISSVARVKPKFPYKSLDASAAEYVGLYLKGEWTHHLSQRQLYCHTFHAWSHTTMAVSQSSPGSTVGSRPIRGQTGVVSAGVRGDGGASLADANTGVCAGRTKGERARREDEQRGETQAAV